jgi:hypothetical protein
MKGLGPGGGGTTILRPREWLFTGIVAVGALRHVFWASVLNATEWNWELALNVSLINNWFDWTHAQCLLRRRQQVAEGNGGIGRPALTGA